jgi:hypothetical protein
MIDDRVSIPEACACLDVDGDSLTLFLAAGSLKPDHLTLRTVLFCRVLRYLPMVDERTAIDAAITAARGAADNGRRALIIVWNDAGEPACRWCDPNDTGDDVILDRALMRPTMAIPADTLLEILAARLAAYRAAKTRLN